MVKLTATNLPSPAAPYLLEVGEIPGEISWDRRNDAEPVIVRVNLAGLSRKDANELRDVWMKLGSYRKVSVRLFCREPQESPVIFSGFIKNVNPRAGNGSVTLDIEEAEQH